MPVASPPLEILPDTRLLIGAERTSVSSGGEHRHRYPANGSPTTRLPLAGAEETDRAVRSARLAFPGWRDLPGSRRRDLLLRLSRLLVEEEEPLSRLQTLESGMPRRVASTAPAHAAEYLTHYAGWADKLGGEVVPTPPRDGFDYALDEPYGVVGIIIPWNAPLMSFGQVVGAALAAGNTVVLKPSELAPFTSLRAGELALRAGLPPGVLNVVPGGAEAGQALARSAEVDKLHFTGSGETAREILTAASRNLTPVALELGGKSPLLVFSDADLMAAAQQAVSGAVLLSGQGCTLGTRVGVASAVYDKLVRIAARMLQRVSVGDPFDPKVHMGPVIGPAACERILSLIERARQEEQGRLVTGGDRLGGDLSSGYFIAPTLFADVDRRSELARQEIFGPVVSFLPFENDEDAIALANDSPYGLAAYVHTRDLPRAHRLVRALEAGIVAVNGLQLPVGAPFGGMKRSGSGRVGGLAGIREFVRPKNAWVAI